MPRYTIAHTATAPLLVLGMLFGGAGLAMAGPASRPCPIPPCSPDGACYPKTDTWGWYQTHWRAFPGDMPVKTPTAAEQQQKKEEEQLRGPQLPEPGQESQVGPEKPAAAVPGAPGAGAAAPGAPPAGAGEPGALPPPVPGEPPAAQPPAGGGQAPSALPPPQGAMPRGMSPLGADRHTTPISPNQSTSDRGLDRSARTARATSARAAVPARPSAAQPRSGANMPGDDSPPALPPSLKKVAARPSIGQAAWLPDGMTPLPPLVQPTSVQSQATSPKTSRRVSLASAQGPTGAKLVNPAAAIATDPGDARAQQAIYFEASDRAGQPQALPTVQSQ